ncbi:tetratricopeptide repeat protein [Chitinilyticum piscinae]|uniref:Tetratricopeptide repeat protein n=1 Tax=Chitinilyticum piscinae TaxID=2866724 RepID=A0A8J7FKT8_9NEIS|nr:tetratricopeptide repeat protein [Chitinilyticum piscinae]MBE9609872.1 tetratricopeptide repeat protein [Chitinilyticum piscinae]
MSAAELIAAAHEAWNAGQYAETERCFLAALALAPDVTTTHFDLGLFYKYEARWADSLRHSLRAAELDAGNEGAWWNAGIAATALQDWSTAARAWQAFGIAMPLDTLPPDLQLGLVPIRITIGERAEVVWAQRLDPARARIINIPFPESHAHFADIVLHDGAPNGYRELDGQQVPVFDALAVWEESGLRTFVLDCLADSPAPLQMLGQLAHERGRRAQDWTQSVRYLCKACDEGTPHEHHDQNLDPGWQQEREVAVAARDAAELNQLLDAWQAACPAVVVRDIYEAVAEDAAEGEQTR